MVEFKAFAKIPRLSRSMIVTEKIDGTNGQIGIYPLSDYTDNIAPYILLKTDTVFLLAGSHKRWLKTTDDNFGFANWASHNAQELLSLGEGVHWGEWWGQGIQRSYGATTKNFSLFNTGMWLGDFDNTKPLCPPCCKVVPVLYRGEFSTDKIDCLMTELRSTGSHIMPFMNPEGIVVWHEASRTFFKKTFENDEGGKGTNR